MELPWSFHGASMELMELPWSFHGASMELPIKSEDMPVGTYGNARRISGKLNEKNTDVNG